MNEDEFREWWRKEKASGTHKPLSNPLERAMGHYSMYLLLFEEDDLENAVISMREARKAGLRGHERAEAAMMTIYAKRFN